MRTNAYKIAILSDLGDSTDTTIKTGISLAKKLQGSIDFFHVKKPTEIIRTDNQLSAIRSITAEYTKTNKEINELITSYNEDYDVAINSSFTFGNIKLEIDHFLKENNPDIVVIGKRKNGLLNAFGDKITKFILQNQKGVVIIASKQKELNPEDEISIGRIKNSKEIALGDDFLTCVEGKSDQSNFSTQDKLENVFGKQDNISDSLSSYVRENNINLLFVDKANKDVQTVNSVTKLVNKVNVSLAVLRQ